MPFPRTFQSPHFVFRAAPWLCSLFVVQRRERGRTGGLAVLPEVSGPRPHTGLAPSPELAGGLVRGLWWGLQVAFHTQNTLWPGFEFPAPLNAISLSSSDAQTIAVIISMFKLHLCSIVPNYIVASRVCQVCELWSSEKPQSRLGSPLYFEPAISGFGAAGCPLAWI